MAISLTSSINLKNINRSLSGLTESVRSARSSTSNMRKSLTESNRSKRTSLSSSSTIFRKRREAVLRREKEDLIEAGSVGGAVKRVGKVAMNSTKGFFGRILEYLGLVLVGWAVNNLPKIMKFAQDLIGRMQKYFAILQDFVGGVSEILLGFGDIIGGIYTSVSTLNFGNFQNSMTTGLKRMQDGIDRISDSTLKGVNMLTTDARSMLSMMGFNVGEFNIPGLQEEELPEPQQQGAGQQSGSAGPYPDPKSVEMYRIAAALSTEGNSDQGYADMMQVLANRKASGYGATYTEILSATGQFAGVENRGSAAFRSIRSLGEASAWSGQSQATLLKIISLMTDPARQANAASFVKGALEFRGSPQNVKGDPRIEADANGFIKGTVWRGTSQDNQFIISNPAGSTPVRIRPGGAAPLGNLPTGKTQPQTPEPPTPTPEPAAKQEPKVSGSLIESLFNLLQTSPQNNSSSINVPEPVATNTIIIRTGSNESSGSVAQRVIGSKSPSFDVARVDMKNLLNSDDILMLRLG